MRCEYGLRPLEVRIAGNHHACFPLCRFDERLLQIGEERIDFVDGIADPELHIGGDLIVATAAGVQLAAEVAELRDQGPFDVRVNVFERDRKFHLPGVDGRADLIQCGRDLFRFGGCEHPDLAEHSAVGLTGANVVAIEPAIERDGLGERLHARIGAAGEPPAPGLLPAHVHASTFSPPLAAGSMTRHKWRAK